MQQAGADRSAQCANAVGEEDEDRGRRQGETDLGGERAQVTGSHQPDRESNLAARWARQELAKPDKIGEGVFVDPFPSQDELVAEVADVSDRTGKQVSPSFRKIRNTSAADLAPPFWSPGMD